MTIEILYLIKFRMWIKLNRIIRVYLSRRFTNIMLNKYLKNKMEKEVRLLKVLILPKYKIMMVYIHLI